jgi:hypothetical protein
MLDASAKTIKAKAGASVPIISSMAGVSRSFSGLASFVSGERRYGDYIFK